MQNGTLIYSSVAGKAVIVGHLFVLKEVGLILRGRPYLESVSVNGAM